MNYVLVHGGGQGGWCYQFVAKELRAAGHEVWTPTLTGFGERSHLGVNHDFETLVTDVVNTLEFEDIYNAILVGHSMAGVIVPRVAEAVPHRIRTVAWLAAVVLLDGETLPEALPPTPAIAQAIKVHGDGTAETDVQRLIDAILSDGTPQQRIWVAERFRDYPRAAIIEPGSLSAFLKLDIPTAYIAARRDLVIPIELARGFAERLPGAAWAEVDASHSLMVSHPRETAQALQFVALSH